MGEKSKTDHRLLVQIWLRNFLSFGPDALPLVLENLNVLIGPNGSGKSNLIEALALFRGARVARGNYKLGPTWCLTARRRRPGMDLERSQYTCRLA